MQAYTQSDPSGSTTRIKRNKSGRERRRFERWRPGDTTTAFMTSLSGHWCGRILNLSDGGAEVLGVPPGDQLLGSRVSVEILLENYSVTRHGILASVRSAQLRDSHALAFDDDGLFTEIEYACCACGAILEMAEGETLELLGSSLCKKCEELAAIRLGYVREGWGA